MAVRRYTSENNERWIGFEHRPGDIVVSTRSKCGTTWAQMICCLLIHKTADLPAPLGELSPWLDWRIEPLDVVRRRLAAQDHRRVIKTHVPLDGLPLDPVVAYVVVARHPLDVAVSFFHHLQNLDQVRMADLTGGAPRSTETVPLHQWLDRWIDDQSEPVDALDTLAGNFHHVNDAWSRRSDPNVVLLHYENLGSDLAGQMRGLADRLGIEVPPERWSELVGAAKFEAMRDRSTTTSPDHLGVLKDRRAFFRLGRVGEGVASCTAEQLARYHQRATELVTPGLLPWLHRSVHLNGYETW